MKVDDIYIYYFPNFSIGTSVMSNAYFRFFFSNMHCFYNKFGVVYR